MRPEGVYEIVYADTEEALKRVGRWVTFPFDLETDNRVNMLYPKQHNPKDVGGKWMQTSLLKDFKFEDGELFLTTENTTYTLERVL